MTSKRFAVAIALPGLGMLGLLLLWGLHPAPRTGTGALTITFAGVTNDATGATLVQFRVANGFSRRVQFGVGEIQARQTNGWPDWMRVAGGAAWLGAEAGSDRLFTVTAPPPDGTVWRVPLIYREELPMLDELREKVKGLLWAIPRLRPGRPLPTRIGTYRSSFVNGPEMTGLAPGLQLAAPKASDSP